MLFSELVNLFLRYNSQNRAPRTAEFYRDHLRKIVALYGDLDAAELRPHHMLEFVPTWHRVLCVQRLYRWAVDEQDLLQVNPLLKLKRPRLGKRRRVLEPLELVRLLRASRADFRRFLLFARETAARPQECRLMRWEDLQWQGGHKKLREALAKGEACFVLSEYKGRSRRADSTAVRLIPVSPRLGRMLFRLCRGRLSHGLILETEPGKPWTRDALRMRLGRVRKKVGIEQRVQGEGLCCYSVRHTTLTSLAAQGFPMVYLQELAGHASLSTTQRYIHLARKQLMASWREFHHRQRRPGER